MPSEALRILEALVKAKIALHENSNHDHRPHWVGVTCPSCGVDYRSVSAVDGETRFNPYHVPSGEHGGEFTSGSGGDESKSENKKSAHETLSQEWNKSLTETERGALDQYAGNNYKSIQDTLREGKRIFVESDYRIALIDRALKKASTSKDIVVYRGISNPSKIGLTSDIEAGTTIKDAAYMSTTLKPSIAREFAGKEGALLRIKVPAGSHAASLHGISENPSEKEVLISRGSTLRITGVSTRNNRQIYHAILSHE